MIALRNICRFLVGGLFIFSGFVKIVDPLGMSYKLEKYYHVFDEKLLSLPLLATLIIPLACLALFLLNLTFFTEGHWWKWVLLIVISVGSVATYLGVDSQSINNGEPINYSFLSNYSLFFSVLLTVLEICLGVALLTLYRIQQTSWMLLVLIAFFTWLTLFTALTGQPKDCGCFGDFLKLDPWVSFGKDIVLLGMIVVIFLQRNNFKSKAQNLKGALFNLGNAVFWVLFANYNINHLPVLDFRHYAVGNDLEKLMNDGDSKEKVGYAVLKDGWEVLIYDDYTKPDMAHFQEPYQWIGTVPMVEGKSSSIKDFSLYRVDTNGEDIDVTTEVLTGPKLLFIINHLNNDDEANFGKALKSLETATMAQGTEFWVVSADFRTKFDEFNKSIGLKAPYHTIDKDEAKAVLRGNSGLLLLNNGVVKGKWHINDIPDIKEIESNL